VSQSGRLFDVSAGAPDVPQKPQQAPETSKPKPVISTGSPSVPEMLHTQAAPQQAPGSRPAQEDTKGQPNGNGGGWIRDLLRSASREESETIGDEGPSNARSALHVV